MIKIKLGIFELEIDNDVAITIVAMTALVLIGFFAQ